jgi:tRNA 2-thiouridine synthesizing protein E
MPATAKTLQVNGKEIATDNEGYMLDPSEWSEDVALQIAQDEGLEMTQERWVVVKFVRDYYETNHSVPEARRALKDLATELGEDKGTRKFLYSLFPYGYGQQACKIAGMRKPLKLILDL